MVFACDDHVVAAVEADAPVQRQSTDVDVLLQEHANLAINHHVGAGGSARPPVVCHLDGICRKHGSTGGGVGRLRALSAHMLSWLPPQAVNASRAAEMSTHKEERWWFGRVACA